MGRRDRLGRRALGFNRLAQGAVRPGRRCTRSPTRSASRSPSWPGEADRAYASMALFDEQRGAPPTPGGTELGRIARRAPVAAQGVARPRRRDRADALLAAAAERLAAPAGPAAGSRPVAEHAAARAPSSSSFCPSSLRRPGRPLAVVDEGERRARAAPCARGSAAEPAAGPDPLVRRPGRAGARLPPLRARRRTARCSPRVEARARFKNEHTASSSTPRAATRFGLRRPRARARPRRRGASAFGFGQVVRDLYSAGCSTRSARARPGSRTQPTRRRTAACVRPR